MKMRLQPANLRDAADIAALRLSSARELTRQHGDGPWSFAAESEGGVRTQIIGSSVFVARVAGRLVATLRLSTRNPWLGDIGFFSPRVRPLYLTSMVVAPNAQRSGIGRQCLTQICHHARQLKGDAIRLDTYEGAGGAGEFYRKCGFREVHRAEYHGTPLIWFEAMLDNAVPAEPCPVKRLEPERLA